MFWDDLVRRLRREGGGLSPRLLRATGGHVAAFPAPRQRRRSRVPWIVAILAGLVVLGLLLGSRSASASDASAMRSTVVTVSDAMS